jgi:hypothetical protein
VEPRQLYRSPHLANFLALVVSATAATLAPLHVFLFAYAFLGPLHYLTEMAWLKKKNFFSAEGLLSPAAYVLIACALCLAVSADFYLHRGITATAIALLVVLSLSTRIRDPRILLAVIATGLLARYFLHGFVIFVAAILPTIVHVYFFTLLFMLSGLVRETRRPSKAGEPRTLWNKRAPWVNPLLLLTLPLVLLRAHPRYASPGPYWLNAEAGFADLHGYLVHLLGGNLHPDASILASPAAAAVLRLLAFIYLFHYLNWFTKTELLQWHRVSRRSWTVILALYALSVGCYLWNFTVGFYLVNFLSLLHVFLEFPLNWHTGQFLTTCFAGLWKPSSADNLPVKTVR